MPGVASMLGKRMVLVGVAVVVVALVGASLESNATNPASALSTPRGTALEMRGLVWRIVSAQTARRIVNQYVPATARGIFVILDVRATNATRHIVSLEDDQLKLALGRSVYPVDTSAVAALELAGHRTLPHTDLGPRVTSSGWIAFDVAPTATKSRAQLCIDQRHNGAGGAPACLGTPSLATQNPGT
jgi:hypothetical protein